MSKKKTAKDREIQRITDLIRSSGMEPKEFRHMVLAMRNYKSRQFSTHKHDFSGKRIRFGVLGDTHFGNKWTDKQFLSDVMREMKKEKVEAVYHTGDLLDGPWQRHKNVLEQYAHGLDNQVDDFVRDFPDRGVPVYVINGNHDLWYTDAGSGNPARMISERRDDVEYLGDSEAMIKFGKVEMMLSHPNDGTSYAYSYKGQKFIESLVKMEEKVPNLIMQGHYHKIFYMNAAGTNYFCTGATIRQTPWMRGKKIAADIGAWIIDIHKNSKGELVKLSQTLLPHKGNKHEQAIE